MKRHPPRTGVGGNANRRREESSRRRFRDTIEAYRYQDGSPAPWALLVSLCTFPPVELFMV
jgi:hypothetical protein